MGKKKILFINGHLNAGGVERSLVDVLRHFDHEKYEVDLLLLEGRGDYLPEIPKEVNVFMYPLNDASGPLIQTLYKNLVHGRWVLFCFRFLMLAESVFGKSVLKYVRFLFRNGQKNYDACIAYRTDLPTMLAAYTFKAKRRISWWHNGEMNLSKKKKKEYEKAYLRLNVIAAVSESSAAMIREAFPQVENRIKVIPNMLCADEMRQKAKMGKTSMDVSIFNIVSVGRLSPEKNMLFCVEIAKILQQQGFSFHWYVIGDGVEEKGIRERVYQYHLEDSFSLMGKKINPYPYIQEAHLLFHPSLTESQCLTVLEAMALHTPVVVVESAGPQEFIRSGENGILIRPDVVEAVNAIVLLMSDKKKALEMAGKANDTVGQFAPERIIGLIEQLI